MCAILIIGDNMRKTIFRVLVVIFILIAIFVTANLLAYNDYEVAEFGNKSFVLADKNMEKYGYNKGDLIITTKANNDNIKIGDAILFYNNYESKVAIEKGTVTEISSNNQQYYLDTNISISKEYVLGTADSVKTVSKVGSILKVLETRVGYLLIILLPTLVLFAYLIRKIVVELKEEKK